MNNRPNNFDGFFDNDAPMMEPTPAQLAEALAHMTSKFPDWYTKPVFRMMAYSAVTKMVDFLEEAMGKGEKPDIHIAWVALMMVVQALKSPHNSLCMLPIRTRPVASSAGSNPGGRTDFTKDSVV